MPGIKLSTEEGYINHYYDWGTSERTERYMLHAGWCPSAIAKVRKELDCLLYAASLRSPSTEKDHSRCTKRSCVANQINKEIYQIRHVSNNCQCVSWKPDEERILEIIKDGGVPLVCFPVDWPADSESLVLEVIRYQPGQQYVAISHVWADGLGNPYENALPAFQIWNLWRTICSMYTTVFDNFGIKYMWVKPFLRPPFLCPDKVVPFWIDTLCVPVIPSLQNYRREAIRRMRQTYIQADKVLMLDDDLSHVSRALRMSKEARLEFSFRMYLSGWYSRLWTLQEGKLARDAWFRIKDATLPAKVLYSNLALDKNGSMHRI
ncbi:MAG: hypothetical protein M1834_004986 [Cirrosporium novae-zelandiae]|nr:MAG: hypothetical protein M1834_004986 [Cirrosporium novae-zelandiae]